MKKLSALDELLDIMARLRAPGGCPWDREQDHKTLRWHAVEEVYELIDAIDAGDDDEMEEELGDLLLQVVFHCQLARERGAFDFERVARRIGEKLIRRHPHVFGEVKVKNVDEVWANWEKIKTAEKRGARHERLSALDGIPRQLPSLMRAEKLIKKARKAGLMTASAKKSRPSRRELAQRLFGVVKEAQAAGWSAEEVLRAQLKKEERALRKIEKSRVRKLSGTD